MSCLPHALVWVCVRLRVRACACMCDPSSPPSCSGRPSRLRVPCQVSPLPRSEPAAPSQDPSVWFTGTRSWLHFDPLFDPGNLFQTQTLNIKTYIDWCPKEKLGWWIHPHPRRHHLFVASLHVFLCAPLWKIPKRTKDLIRKRFSNRLSSPLRGELGEDQGLQGMMQRYCVKLKGQVHSGVIETLRRS